MANPQLENGYTKVANEIFEALCGIRIPGETRQVIDVVIRKTYGYNKKEDCISLSQFCLLTKMRRGDVCRAINKAVSMNILKVISKEANGKGNKYCVVKDFDSWKALAKKRRGVANKLMSISKKANKGVAKKLHTKERVKETIKESVETSSTEGFSLKEAIKKLEESPRRDLQIVGFYLSEREGLDIRTRDQAKEAVGRHIRAAKKLIPFDDDQLVRGFKKARDQTSEWTLETVMKILTK